MNPFSALLGNVPENPFYQPRPPLWLPVEMAQAPPLPPIHPGARRQRRLALLINPFYAKFKHRLVHAAWRPMVELTRLRHVRFRERLARATATPADTRASQRRNLVPAGV